MISPAARFLRYHSNLSHLGDVFSRKTIRPTPPASPKDTTIRPFGFPYRTGRHPGHCWDSGRLTSGCPLEKVRPPMSGANLPYGPHTDCWKLLYCFTAPTSTMFPSGRSPRWCPRQVIQRALLSLAAVLFIWLMTLPVNRSIRLLPWLPQAWHGLQKLTILWDGCLTDQRFLPHWPATKINPVVFRRRQSEWPCSISVAKTAMTFAIKHHF